MSPDEAIAFLRALRGPWLGDGFHKVHRDALIEALRDAAPPADSAAPDAPLCRPREG